jgi:ArsR family transcriptional regulator
MMAMSTKDFNLHKLFLRALSNETRLLVLETLRTEAKCVSEISEDLGFEQSRVSHSLKCLCNCGFVEVERQGKKRIYRINKETIVPLFETIDRHVAKYGQGLVTCETLADVKALAKGEA